MEREVLFQYETAANASYLVASVRQEDFIRYEMKMLENNAITYLLPAKKFQQDDRVQIHYNVTARMTLQQLLTRQQMKKNEFLSLLAGILSAYDELLEYQLSLTGLLLDEEHIFVKPGSFDPGFIYLPIYSEDNGLKSLRDFVMRMVMESRIANTNDDFVQRLIGMINDPSMTLQQMHSEVRKLSAAKAAPRAPEVPKGVPAPKVPEFNPGGQTENRGVTPPVEQPPAAPTPVNHGVPTPPPKVNVPPVTTDKTPGKKGVQKPKTVKVKEKKEKGSSSKESIIFVAIQAAFVLLAALLLKRGFFVQEGQINYSYIAGVAILILGADFVLYRELFVNRKKKSTAAAGKPGKAASGKSGKLPKAPGAKTDAVKPPVAQQPAAHSAVQDYAPQKPVASVTPVDVAPANIPMPESVIPSAQPYYPPESGMDMDPNGGKTVLMDEYGAGEGYLEYVENGLVKRIHLTNEVTVVGSRPQNVDYVLNSKRVSKVHAEFIRCGDQYSVRDINSTNGTYLNGGAQRIVSNQDFLLKNGDRVRLGDMELTFKC